MRAEGRVRFSAINHERTNAQHARTLEGEARVAVNTQGGGRARQKQGVEKKNKLRYLHVKRAQGSARPTKSMHLRLTGGGHHARNARDVDDATAPLIPHHAASDGLGHQERSHEVRVQYLEGR